MAQQGRDKSTQTDPFGEFRSLEKPSQSCCSVTLPGWLAIPMLSLFVAWVAFVAYGEYLAMIEPKFSVPPEIMEDLGMDGVILFKQHDRDYNGVLDLHEFEPLAHRLLEVNETFVYDLPIKKSDDVLTIETHFKPFKLSSLSNDHKKQVGVLDPLFGLKHWKNPAKEWQNFAAQDFRYFLPKGYGHLRDVGRVYRLIAIPDGIPEGMAMSSNRYLPPRLEVDTEIMIHRLLAMFHPHPFVVSRFAPHGSIACIRAHNKDYVDVAFRIHAEFQVNEPPFQPFWFTPGQFTGHIILSKNGGKVHYFHLYVPTDRSLNVDMEWLTHPGHTENMEVEIGFLPQMELRSTSQSIPAFVKGMDNRDIPVPSDTVKQSTEEFKAQVPHIEWEEEISLQEAYRRLEIKFLPFKQVDYHRFEDVFSVAAAQQKLVHSVVLWGALDDQSC